MTAPFFCAQEVITCSCKVSLCEDCRCEFHPQQRCEAHCQQCDVLVCMKCVITSHNGHNVRDIPNIFTDKKREIQKETQEIKSRIIPKCKKKNEDTERIKTLFMGKCNELEKETENQRNVWHREVDKIYNKLSTLIKSKRNDHLTVLNSHQSKLRNLIEDLNRTVYENKEMLKSNKVSKVTDYKSKLTENRNILADIDVSIPTLETNTAQGRELRLELEQCKAILTQRFFSSLKEEMSSLSTKELLDKARVIATFQTDVKPLYRVVCVGADKAWVSGQCKPISFVDIHGSVHDSVTTTLTPSEDSSVPGEGEMICVSGELIYSNYNNRTVNIFRHGRSEVMITTSMDWKPAGLSSSKSGDILVNLYNGHQNKIVRYQGQRVSQEIFKDENEKTIYGSGKWMLFVAENNNEDICASDRNADTVVVVDKKGRVRFKYDGTPARVEKTFDPNQLVTDSMSRIIVSDWRNDCLHILDQDGQFLRCVDNCELSNPRGLSVDSEGRLWVGLFEKGEVKLVQYRK